MKTYAIKKETITQALRETAAARAEAEKAFIATGLREQRAALLNMTMENTPCGTVLVEFDPVDYRKTIATKVISGDHKIRIDLSGFADVRLVDYSFSGYSTSNATAEDIDTVARYYRLAAFILSDDFTNRIVDHFKVNEIERRFHFIEKQITDYYAEHFTPLSNRINQLDRDLRKIQADELAEKQFAPGAVWCEINYFRSRKMVDTAYEYIVESVTEKSVVMNMVNALSRVSLGEVRKTKAVLLRDFQFMNK